MADVTHTIKASGGDFTTLNAALVYQQGGGRSNLTIDNGSGGPGKVTYECYASVGADTTAAALNTGVVSSSYYHIITAASDSIAGKSWSTSKYRLSVSNAKALSISLSYTRVKFLQLEQSDTGATGNYPPLSLGAEGQVEGCFVRNLYNGSADRGTVFSANDSPQYAWNSYFVSHCTETSGSVCFVLGSYNGYIYNCVITGCRNGTFRPGFQTQVYKNCYVRGTTIAFNYNFGQPTTVTCMIADTYAPSGTTGSIAYSTSSGTKFTNITAGSEDFTLQSGSSLIDAGTDLSGDATLPFSTDIDGGTRSGTWDLGPDEYGVPVGGGGGGGAYLGRIARHRSIGMGVQ